jgi:glycosyltransferase involved in cell wall biosynthesis
MDQYTSVSFKGFANHVDQTICISPYHVDYFKKRYRFDAQLGFSEPEYIDLPVRSWDYPSLPEKDPNMVIFTSVPDRGLNELMDWWHQIKSVKPGLKLYVTSDYRLWGCATSQNVRYKMRASSLKDIEFLGALPRKELIDLQLKATYMFYPCIYDELFCIALSEAQYAGVHTVSTSTGACGTTNMVDVVDLGGPFIVKCQEVAQKATDPVAIREKAIERFSPEAVLKQWNKKVFSKI